ncbi:MAG TPA: PAS domain S-box protein [Chthoniobacterales bacterium]|nr:PAS domain S-box protein [Chthoniobacterales bacterium]
MGSTNHGRKRERQMPRKRIHRQRPAGRRSAFPLGKRKVAAEAQARLAAIVHSSDDAIISKDLNGVVNSWNRAAERIFGFTAAEAIGQPITLIIPTDRRDEESRILARIRRGELVEHFETVRMHKEGRLVDISLTISPVRDAQGRIIGASKIARDISDRKRAQEALRFREQRQRLLAEIGMFAAQVAAADPAQIDRLIAPVCQKLAAELNVSHCGFSRIDVESGEIFLEQEAHDGLSPLKGIFKLSDIASLFLAHGLAGRTTVVDDMATDPQTEADYVRRYKAANVRSVITVPLHRHGQWVGNLGVAEHEPRHWTEGEIELVQTVAERLWAVLEQARSVSVEKEAARQQEALYRFANRLQHVTSEEEIYDGALDAIVSALRCDRASILLFDDEGVMRFVAARGLSESYRKAVEGHSPWTRDTVDPQPIYVNDLAVAYLEEALKNVLAVEGIRALGFIPLLADGKLIGKFMAYYNEQHLFRRGELELALTIGRQIAFAIQRKRAEDKLRESEQRLRLATETGKVGAWEWDIEANRVSWSDSLFALHGVRKEEFDETVEGFASLVHPEDRDRVAGAIDKSLREGVPYELTFRALRPNGETVWLFTNAAVIRDGNRPIRMIGASTDVTELKRTEQALERAKREAEEANQTKDQFLAMLSHELRTPLTPVLMAITSLEHDPDNSNQTREQLAMMRRNIELEARLIDDLLDITRIAHGKLELHQELVDVHAAIDHALKISTSGIDAKRLQVTSRLSATHHYCRADAARLQEVFWNILRNAVKFTPENGKIEVSTWNEESRIVVEISDNGIGIEPAIQPRIFDAFAQGEPAIRARFGGLGLGLAISKRIIDLHRGTIEVRSTGRGHGSTFIIKLDFAERPPLREPMVMPMPPSAELPARILVVEDHEDTARVLSRILEKSGYMVVTCGSVQQACALAAAQKFDLVVSDLGLPDGSGLGLMQHLRDTQQLSGIALSGFGTAADVDQSRAAGFAVHLTKPVDVDRLRLAITTRLRQVRSESAV